MSAYLQREVYKRLPSGVTTMFEPPEGAQLVDVEWDDEVVLVTWLRLPVKEKP